MQSDDWPGVFELDALALEIRLNDPRTTSIKPSARAKTSETVMVVGDRREHDALVSALARRR